jgi:2'-5' RNA ligase
MYCQLGGAGADRVNSFALVTYIPEPMGSFLNSLREELVPNCNVYSHVTVLPPRPLQGSPDAAWERIVREASETPVFDIQTTRIEIFPVTSVIYLAIGEGSQELRRMHDRLNRHELAYDEPYTYHPHITLAQELPPDRVAEAFEVATRRWREFSHSRRFPLDHVTFVQNTIQKQWLDLKEVPLAQPAPVAKV